MDASAREAPSPRLTSTSMRLDVVLATAIGLIALVFYLRTLYPGLGGGGDQAKFQYIGGVLGTGHPPGYPLYILISYCFAHLPIGSPAFRINFMSAFFAATAVALAFLILVRLGSHRMVAACAALGLAFDRYLWAKAVGAEVYSLAAALVALIVWLALRWSRTARDRDLYWMSAVFGLSLGNHLTVATILPALAIFVLIVRPRSIRVTTVVVTSLLVMIGLTQYGLIILRTLQHAPYVEARATNLRELYGVLRATPYADEIGAFTLAQVLHDRVPLLWKMVSDDFGPLGLWFLVAGLVTTIVRRMAAGVLLVLAAAGVIVLTLNVDADVDGFLVSALLLMWLVAGLGMQGLWALISRAGRPGRLVTVLVMLLLPPWQVQRNYARNDHHRRTYETRYMNALFAQLESRAAIAHEAYSVDQLVLYKLAAEHAAGARTVIFIPSDVPTVQRFAADGFTVYAFSGTRAALDGRGFGFEPVQLRDPGAAGRGDASASIDMSPLPLYRVIRRAPCLALGNTGWRDVTTIANEARVVVRVDNYRPFDSTVVMYTASRATAADPAFIMSQGLVPPTTAIETFRSSAPADIARLQSAIERDSVPDTPALRRAAVVHRVALRVNDQGQFSISAFALGEAPEVALVRASVDLNNPLRATVCGWSGRDYFASATVEHPLLGADGDAMFGQGWSPAERAADGSDIRWTSQAKAELALPLSRVGPLRVRLRLQPFALPSSFPRTITLSVNGMRLPSQRLDPEWRQYEFAVPEAELRHGLNRVTIEVAAEGQGQSSEPRALTVAVGEWVVDLVAASGR